MQSIVFFCFQVFNGLADRIQAAAMSLVCLFALGIIQCQEILLGDAFNSNSVQINQERYGQLIDGKLLQDVIGIFMEIGQNRSPSYYEIIETAMLGETATFYSRLSSQWLLCDSLTDYIQKVFHLIKLLRSNINYDRLCK